MTNTTNINQPTPPKINVIEELRKTHRVKRDDSQTKEDSWCIYIYGPVSTAQVAEWKALPGFDRLLVRTNPNSHPNICLLAYPSDEEVFLYKLLESI